MSQPYYKILKKHGPTEIIEPPVTSKFPAKKYTIGIAGRFYETNRKGRNLIEGLKRSYLGSYIKFKFTFDPGFGEVEKYKNFSDMYKFYHSLDYYLCSSTIEGGPMTVKEAALCGVKVIAPKGVGFCDKYADFLYKKGDLKSLIAVLHPLITPKIRHEESDITYWIQQHIEAFKEI
jgi:glycosyltransferase involved in cell wall biosynthesis